MALSGIAFEIALQRAEMTGCIRHWTTISFQGFDGSSTATGPSGELP